MERGVAIKLNFLVWDVEAQEGLAGDLSNITIYLIKDGVLSIPTNLAVEVDASDAPGECYLQITSDEANCQTLKIIGSSTTSGVRIFSPTYTAIRRSVYSPTQIGMTYANEYELERGETWDLTIDNLTLSATRDKLYFTLKEASLSTPLDEVTDANSIVQIEETAGLTYLNATAQTTPNSDGSLTASVGLDELTIALAATASTQVPVGTHYYFDVREVEGSEVTCITNGRITITSEVTRSIT